MGIHFKSFSGRDLDGDTISQVYKIEQDMWARENGLGEYITCENCGMISSKEKVYTSLDQSIRKKTVADIEQILGMVTIFCPCCQSGKTKHIRGDTFYKQMKSTLCLSDSFCTFMRGSDEKIAGFIYGYRDSLDTIYHGELKEHFSTDVIDTIKQYTSGVSNDALFTISGVGTNETYIRLHYLFQMIQVFFNSLPQHYDTTMGIGAVVRSSTMSKFYKFMGGEKIEVGQHISKQSSVNIDIMLHDSMIHDYKNKDINLREILQYCREQA